MSKVIEMPLYWTEKLESIQVGGFLPISEEDKIGTVHMAKNRLKKSKGLEFKIRTDETGEKKVWRTA